MCIVFCSSHIAYNYYKKNFREKLSVSSILGLALANICNEENQNPHNIIENGVGKTPDVITEWVDDIWDTYDVDGDGNLDRREIRKFVDQTLEKVGIKDKVAYHEYDLDEFFEEIDVTENGIISRAEMRNFFRKLGKRKPDDLLRKKIGLRVYKVRDGVLTCDTD